MPITTQHTQESLCLSHIYALAGMAGINYAIRKVYDYGVDGQFNTVKGRTGRKVDSGVPLNFQAKTTIDWELRNGQIVYDLLCLPRDQVNWHLIEAQATICGIAAITTCSRASRPKTRTRNESLFLQATF